MIIPLGTIVRCRVTGFVGVAENRATFMYGCDRYCVQPQIGDDGKIPDNVMIDAPQLEIVEPKTQVMSPLAEPPTLVEMGQLVEDPIRGMEGTITGRAVYLNGCSRVWVSPKQNPRYEKVESWWVDEKQVIGKKTFLGKEKIPVKPEALRRTGGPAPSCSKY